MTNDLAETPIQFRLLSDGLIGYAWPKWVRAGQSAELRIHAIEQYQLTLWRYGSGKGVCAHDQLVR